MAQLIWMDKKGAGRMETILSAAKAERKMSTLRRNATLYNSNREVIGKVERHPENHKRWMWWFDKSELA